MLFRRRFCSRRCISGRVISSPSRMQKRIRNRHRLLWRAPTRRALMVHHLLQAAMFKQHMLPRPQLIRRLAKLIRNIQHGGLRPAIFNTRIAIPRHPKLQIKRPNAS
jgi:hypothetical protein